MNAAIQQTMFNPFNLQLVLVWFAMLAFRRAMAVRLTLCIQPYLADSPADHPGGFCFYSTQLIRQGKGLLSD